MSRWRRPLIVKHAGRRKHGGKFQFQRVMCFVAAVVLGVIGTVEQVDTYLLDQRGVVVTATVLDKYEGRSKSIDVRYLTATGTTVENDTAKFLDAEIGDQIQVIYDPENPDRMQAVDWGFDYLIGCIWLVGALFLVFAGITMFWYDEDEDEDED